MMKRKTLLFVLLFPSMVSALTPVSADPIGDGGRPNIVLIMADDLGWETLGTYGNTEYETPRLDRLAAEGATFNYAFSTPLCTPSRVMLMTGKYGHRNYDMFGFFPKKDETHTFGNLLKKAGYATCMAGKWHVSGVSAQNMGFDQSMRCEGWGGFYGTKNIWINDQKLTPAESEQRFGHMDYRPDMVVDFITTFIDQQKDRPFFVYYPMYLVHHPEQPTPDSPGIDEYLQGDTTKTVDGVFPDMVKYMDKLVGRIVDHVEDLGLSKKTVFLFVGDNGTCPPHKSKIDGRLVGGGKGSMKDYGTRVPLVVSWRGRSPRGVHLDDLVDFSDFYPTLAALADVTISPEQGIDGVSFARQLQGQPGTPREWAFMHYRGRNSGTWPINPGSYWARTKRWKLYFNGELYDLEKDPDERQAILPERDTPRSAEARRTLTSVFDRLEATPDTLVTKDSPRRSIPKGVH